MAYYRHYSFDLWLTLIRSNPQFKAERSRYFHQRLNFRRKTPDEVAAVFRQVDLMCNLINEKTGKNIDADEMYLMVISMINDGTISLNETDLEALIKDMDQLVFNYLPQVYAGHTVAVLEHMRQSGQATLNILSNTGFIRGQVLRLVLKELGLDIFFDFQLYSDEAGYSKPSIHFFKLMLDKVSQLYGGQITVSQIVHVGDNPVADVWGAQLAGINGLLVNSNNVSLENLITDANILFTAQDQ